MQTHGYLMIKDKKILILVHPKKYFNALKLRFTGSDGNYFKDESIFLSLSENKKILDNLLDGKVVEI
ncbi:unnamed protein product [marine sediment metagenome]|uniref:Uncharacterized protein n=1 Tax=marine sediment metagenome TaxID=412755 RepID=X1U5K9_9ZZZZ